MTGIDALLRALVDSDGSDLHVPSGETPRLRRHGLLVPLPALRAATADEVATLIDAVAPSEARAALATSGDVCFIHQSPAGRFRVACSRRRSGPALVIRRIPSQIETFEALGLPGSVESVADLERGLVLVAGPSGSGRSATVAAMVDHVNRTASRHVVTLESPVEILHVSRRSVVTQRQVGLHTRSTASGLRAALRQDADVIVLGDLVDGETLALALDAAERGTLVIATILAGDVPRALERVVELAPPEHAAHVRTTLADVLQGAVAQRLVPAADGRGRVLAVEVLLRAPGLAALIRDGRMSQLRALMQAAPGMQTMDDALGALVEAGRVHAEDAQRRAVDPERFAR